MLIRDCKFNLIVFINKPLIELINYC